MGIPILVRLHLYIETAPRSKQLKEWGATIPERCHDEMYIICILIIMLWKKSHAKYLSISKCRPEDPQKIVNCKLTVCLNTKELMWFTKNYCQSSRTCKCLICQSGNFTCHGANLTGPVQLLQVRGNWATIGFARKKSSVYEILACTKWHLFLPKLSMIFAMWLWVCCQCKTQVYWWLANTMWTTICSKLVAW